MIDTILMTQDGSHTIHSEQFGVTYHSKYGAIQETQHVFINAALCYKAVVQKDLSILDIGFGTGLNAYLTLIQSLKRNLKIHYVAYEAFPISLERAKTLNYTTLLGKEYSNADFLQLHQVAWNEPVVISDNFLFHKVLKRFEEIDTTETFDIIYFDAFAPSAQPELWKIPLLQKMYQALKKKGVLVTYCAKGQVKRNLKAIGFEVEKLKGPPGKREMTRATKAR